MWKDKRGLTFAHVEYTDGDEEDLELKELKGILVDEKGNEGGKKRSSASSSSFGSLLKKVKGKGDGGGKKDKGKDRDKKSSKRGAEASSSSSLAKRLLKTKRGKGADLEEQDDLLSLSVTGSEHDAAQGRGKASGGGGGDKGKQATAAAGGKARKSDAYHSGLKALIAAGELQAGEGCVCVCRGQDVVTAELLPREDGCYQGAVYASAENLVAHVFGCKKEPAIAGPEQNGEAAAAAEVKEECAATAAAVAAAAAMDVGGGADGAGGAAGEVKGEGEAVIRIEMGGKPVEHWEECMAPIRGGAGQQGTDGGGKAEKEGPDMEAAQGWLRQMEKAVFVLEAVLRDEGAMASIKGGGAGAKGTASEEGARRLANLVHLKVALRKLQSGLRGDGEEEDGPLPQPQEEEEEEGEGEEEKVKGERGGEGAASSSLAAAADSAPVASAAGTHPPPLGKQFSAEVLRLHWLPWLHAEIEQMLRGLPTGGKAALDLQAELAKSLGAVAAAADDEGPAGKTGGEEEEEEGEKAAAAEDAGSAGPGQRQITQIADYRWQLKHMVPEARDVLLEKLQVERAQLKAALTAYNRQARILEAVQTQEEEARRRRREAGRELAAAVAAGEAEEKRLLARLEAVRGRLAAARGQLARVEAQAVEVRLLLRKTQQWKGTSVRGEEGQGGGGLGRT